MRKLSFFCLFILFVVLLSVSVSAAGFLPVFENAVNLSYDDFQGNDFDPWNPDLWLETKQSGTSDNNAEIFSNRGRLNSNSGSVFMTSDQNVYVFSDLDDINFSFTFRGIADISGATKARAYLSDTSGTGFDNGCLTGAPIACWVVGDENGFHIDGNAINTTPTQTGSKVIFNLTKVQDQNNYVVSLYLDANLQATRTVTKNSFDFNWTFAQFGGIAISNFENLDINGNNFVDGNGLIADFNANPAIAVLDPESGLNNVQALFDSNSTTAGITDVNFTWSVNSEQVKVDTNSQFVWDFNGIETDKNISLLVVGTDMNETFTSQKDLNFLQRISAQNVDINFTRKTFINNASLTFGVNADGIINYAVWGFPNDQNLTGINVDKNFSTDGLKQVCVIVNSSSDINKLTCKDFTSTRVLVKQPKDKITGTVLTPFDVATNDITRQSYLNQSADLNIFLWFESGDDQNVLFTVDFNASYFSSTFLIETNDSDTFRTIQPLLVLISDSVSSVFHVINAITQNTIPEVTIESRQGSVLIESTITDSTGSATLNFIVGDTYNLTFKFQGVVSLEQEIRPIDTEYFIYLFLEEIITEPLDPETITVSFNPSIGQVQEGEDGNFTLSQTISATRNSITLINIQVDQNGLLFFDSNFTGASGGTFSQDFNASRFAPNSPINVNVTVTSSLINETKKSISYFIQFTSQATFLNAINGLGVNLGLVGRLVLVVLSSFVIVGGFSQATRNPQILGGIVLIWIGAFTAIGLNANYVEWVPVPVFLFALIGAVALYLNR